METKKCENCGKEFTPYKKTQKYCSRACSEAVRIKNTRICVVCNKEFDTAGVTAKCCSPECKEVFRRVKEHLFKPVNERGISLIRYGQQNPFSKATSLWVQYKQEQEEKDND